MQGFNLLIERSTTKEKSKGKNILMIFVGNFSSAIALADLLTQDSVMGISLNLIDICSMKGNAASSSPMETVWIHIFFLDGMLSYTANRSRKS